MCRSCQGAWQPGFQCDISDGQRQRVLLARAICQEPEIIVLDEPTSFLDVKHKLELLSILRRYGKGEADHCDHVSA